MVIRVNESCVIEFNEKCLYNTKVVLMVNAFIILTVTVANEQIVTEMLIADALSGYRHSSLFLKPLSIFSI